MYVYNTWPLIDGALVPEASRLFFDTPLWRNFFENTLTVQFDHRMLAYAILICALLHALDVARTVKKGPALAGAIVLFAAVAAAGRARHLDAALRAPISLALLHQAMAMLVLTAATVHAALVTERRLARRSCRWRRRELIIRAGGERNRARVAARSANGGGRVYELRLRER